MSTEFFFHIKKLPKLFLNFFLFFFRKMFFTKVFFYKFFLVNIFFIEFFLAKIFLITRIFLRCFLLVYAKITKWRTFFEIFFFVFESKTVWLFVSDDPSPRFRQQRRPTYFLRTYVRLPFSCIKVTKINLKKFCVRISRVYLLSLTTFISIFII